MKQDKSTIQKALTWWNKLPYIGKPYELPSKERLTSKYFKKISSFLTSEDITHIFLSEHPEQAMDFKKIKEDSEDLQALVSAEMQEQEMENEDAEIDKLERELWNEPTGAPTTKKEVAVDNSKEGFTSGQWAIRDLEIIGPIGSNKSICEITGNFMDEAEAEANARLIASAPDMYKALKEVSDSFRGMSMINFPPHIRKAVDNVDALLITMHKQLNRIDNK